MENKSEEVSTIKKVENIEDRSGKMWTHESRLFLEKFFYLSKSTTKYVITGVDPVTFQTTMRICDRVTGRNVSISGPEFINFIHNVECLVNGTHSREKMTECGTMFSKIMNGVWKISEVKGWGSLVIQTVSLENLVRGKNIILQALMSYDGDDVSNFINLLRTMSIDVKEEDMLHFLEEELKLCTIGSTRHQILCDLIIKQHSLIHLADYNEGFFRRVIKTGQETQTLAIE